jgi:membrane protease YdiL (CAAX protease family)
MSGTAALATCLVVMLAVNVWVHLGPHRWQPVTGPLLAGLLLVVGRIAGLSWEQLGLGFGSWARGLAWGGLLAAGVAAGYAVALSVPRLRGLFTDERHRPGGRSATYVALLAVPLGTVVFEEVAFRGVLWGLVEAERGGAWAIGATSLLFGLWHVLPAVDGVRANTPGGAPARGVVLRHVAATVAFTALAGVVFGVLRDRSGSLLTPALLHWATNGLGILAAAVAWRRAPTRD